MSKVKEFFDVKFDNKWLFVSVTSGKTYSACDLFLKSVNPLLVPDFEAYKAMVFETETCWLAPDFVCFWLDKMLLLNATYQSDYDRLSYLKKEMTDDKSKKELLKAMKTSETVMEKSFMEYMNLYKDY